MSRRLHVDNEEEIFPYLGGEEVNSHPTQQFDRYAINFGDMTLADADQWPDLLAVVREKVKPERDSNPRDIYRKQWWQYAEKRADLTEALLSATRCLITKRVQHDLTFSFQIPNCVFANTIYVFPFGTSCLFAMLQSRIHRIWVLYLSSTMRMDLNYSSTDCFENFPMAVSVTQSPLALIGEAVHSARAHYMDITWQGLTTTYNQLKDPDYAGDLSPASAERPALPDRSAPPWAQPAGLAAAVPAIAADPELLQPETRVAYIQHLRHLHEELDRAVLAAYGWSDIAVPPYCPPRPTDLGGLAAVSLFEDTIIDRLFALNAERAAEEAAAAGRPAPGKPTVAAKPRTKRAKKPPSSQPFLLDEDS